MVFRRENKSDAFQRQISALRQQLGTEPGADTSLAAAPSEALRPPAEPEPRPSYGRDAGGLGAGDYGSSLGLADFGLGGSAPPDVAAPSVDGQTSVVAHDTTWKGDLQTNGSVHVHGKVEGAIEAKDDVYVAEEAEVGATITAANVAVAGLVRGTVRCSARFEVLPQGRIYGDVLAPTLVVHEGAIVNGQFRMGGDAVGADTPAPLRRRAVRTGA